MTTIRREPAPASAPVSRPYVWRGDPALSLAMEVPELLHRYNGKTLQDLADEWDLSGYQTRRRVKAQGMEPDKEDR